MRIAVSLVAVLLLCCALASAQTTNTGGAPAVVQKASLSGETTVTGCLQGKTDGYYLTEKDGTMRLLMGPDDELNSYVGHWVQLGGNRDNRRDASAGDEGTPHGLRFFQVEEILADQGTCKH